MMTIEVKVNDRVVARANVKNLSNLEEISNYHVIREEYEWPFANRDAERQVFEIKHHLRLQTVWALVARVALGAKAS